MRNHRWWILVALGIAATSCGASSGPPPQSPPPTRGSESESKAAPARPTMVHESAGKPSDQAAAPPAMAPPPPEIQSVEQAPAPEPAVTPRVADPHSRYTHANVEFSEAKRQVDIAAGQRDCASACRALDSMDRAMSQLCELARSDEERRTCKSAADQVSSARERVRKACGECPKKAR